MRTKKQIERDEDKFYHLIREYRTAKGKKPYYKADYDEFSGKLSALRWVLGMEWDMLDT